MKKNNVIAFAFESVGVVIATLSVGLVNVTAGGCVLAAGLILFGISFEEDDS